jgi:predicted RecA/RadA family phage recombinase
MKNQVSEGRAIDVTAPYTVASGAGCLVGSLFGVSAYAAASGAAVTLWLKGVYTLTKHSTEAWTVGELLYWDDTNKYVTATATSNKLIGVATAAAANPSSVGNVRLNGMFNS